MKNNIKKLSIITAALMLMAFAGCGDVDDNGSETVSHDTTVTSSESTSHDGSESSLFDDISIPEVASINDISLPTVSLPTISIPTISSPSFSFSSSAVSAASSAAESSPSNTSSASDTFSTKTDLGDTQTIGNSEMGYLDIPADFLKFEDVVGNTDLQYSDKTATTIFTLNTLGDEDPDTLDLEAGAQALAKRLEDQGAQGLTGARVTVAGKYDAVQVYGYWPEDDTFLVVDLFKTSKRGIYLAVEFPSDNADIINYLDTYRED